MKFRQQNKNGGHKLVSFSAVVAVWSMNSSNFTSLHTSKVETHTTKKIPFWQLKHCESEAILSKRFRPGYPGWSVYMHGRIFIPVTEISVAKTVISVTGPARLFI